MVDRIGQQLGNYQLLSLLGKGGFAEVYLGESGRPRACTSLQLAMMGQRRCGMRCPVAMF